MKTRRMRSGRFVATLVLTIFLGKAASAQKFPAGPWLFPQPLDSWSFTDNSNWTDDNGSPPISFSNIGWSDLGNGSSLVAETNIPAWLNYPIYGTNGVTNIVICGPGSLCFWYAGAWATTNGGPGQWAQLIDAGEWTSNSSFGYFGLSVDPAGSNVWFFSQDGLGDTYSLATPISWTTNYFHFIALSYSVTNVSLYLDGQLATNDPGGLRVWPGPNVVPNGVFFGSDTNGDYLASGLFNAVETFGEVLDSNSVCGIYNQQAGYYFISPWNTPYMNSLNSAPPSAPSAPAYNEISGDGYLQPPVSAPVCVNGPSANTVWITNVVATPVGSGTNLTMNLTFTIEGGQPGVPYDVFANTVLSFGTNGVPWAWMGQGYQCNTYTITDLPNGTCFLILGTPQDTLGVGLTDAYQLLVAKTNPNNPSAAGDGISNGDKVAMGLNPGVAIPAIPSNFTVQACPQ